MRQFFALANEHMRWELNDLARRLDTQTGAVLMQEEFVSAPASSGSGLFLEGRRMLEAIASYARTSGKHSTWCPSRE